MMKYAFFAIFAAMSAVTGAKPQSNGGALSGQLILYDTQNFAGDQYVLDEPRLTVKTDWNIRSISIHAGEKWRICAKPRLQEPCITLDQSLPDASAIGIKGQIGSAKLVTGK